MSIKKGHTLTQVKTSQLVKFFFFSLQLDAVNVNTSSISPILNIYSHPLVLVLLEN